jgi:hypothetical protein
LRHDRHRSPAAGADLRPDEVLFWARRAGPPIPIAVRKPRQARDRHKRKYAEGKLDDDLNFWFRGPGSRLNLRAQNLMVFVQVGEGVDEDTWQFHRQAKDYSRWFRDVIKDAELAAEASEIEDDPTLGAADSRKRILSGVTRRYTASAEGTHTWRDARDKKKAPVS